MLVLAIDIERGVQVDAGEAKLVDQNTLQFALPDARRLFETIDAAVETENPLATAGFETLNEQRSWDEFAWTRVQA